MTAKRKGTDGLIDRIGELGRRIRELEARPVYIPQPIYVQPVIVPTPAPPYVPPPYVPWFGQTICDSVPNLDLIPPATFGITS